MIRRRRQRGTAKESPQPGAGASGEGESGAAFDPTQLTDATAADQVRDGPRAAPAPGSPLSNDEIRKLKAKAETSQTPSAAPGQSDPAAKTERG